MSRHPNPIKDRIAIVGVGTAPYSRAATERSIGAMTLEACVRAIRDAGIDRSAIDGISASTVTTQYVQPGLGIPDISWWSNTWLPFSNQIEAAVHAIHAGACTTALVYHSQQMSVKNSRAAAADPYRLRQQFGVADHRAFYGAGHVDAERSLLGMSGYAAWARRYMHEFGATKKHFGYIAINGRSNAVNNDNAVMRQPLAMSDYLDARIIRDPLCLYDVDVPVDGADAFVITTVERAHDICDKPVLLHALVSGQGEHSDEEGTEGFGRTGQAVATRTLWARSDLQVDDIDLFCLYDGFSIITLNWLENIGLCGRGEAPMFLDDNWDEAQQRLLIDGTRLLNPHGGNLSEGHTDGAGHVREAVLQLRGEAGPRQMAEARTAAVGIGGLFSTKIAALLLRRDWR